MRYRRLGRCDLTVSQIGVGGHHLRRDAGRGDRVFRATAQERAGIYTRALDAGVTFFDTTFREEAIAFGEALAITGRRDEMVLCSMDEQYAAFRADDPRDYGKHTTAELERCLRWLGTDYVDVYWLRYDVGEHTDDMLHYSIDAMRQAKEAGKIRAIGNSGHRPSFMRKTMGEWDAWDVIMFPYNFAHRLAEDYVLPMAAERDVGVVAMKPFSCGRFFRIDPRQGFRDERLRTTAEQRRIATAALQWLLENDRVHTIIPALNDLHHVDDAIAATATPLSDDDRQLLDEIAALSPTYEESYGHD